MANFKFKIYDRIMTFMPNARSLAPLCVFLLTTFITASSNANTQDFDRLMRHLLEKYQVPGGSLSISKDGRLIYAKGFGYADLASKEKMQPTHRFRIASVSKPIAAVAVLKLVEQNKIKLSSKVYQIIGATPVLDSRRINPEIDKITVEDLLRHSSGQEIYSSSDRINSPMQPPVSREISRLFSVSHPPAFEYVVSYMKTQPLLHAVGKNYRYSNYGYTLLGLLVEKLTGVSFENYVRKEIFLPLKIQCMQFGKTSRSEKKPYEVTYYDLSGRSPVRSVFDQQKPDHFPYAGRNIEGWGAAGAWISSSIDLVKFVNHVDGQRKPSILKPTSIKRMIQKQNFKEHNRPGFWYGLGWRVQQKRNGHHWYHNGASNSGSAAIMLRTADGIVWSALFNQRMPAGRKLYKEFNKEMWRIVRSIKQWPKDDLFSKYSFKNPHCR